MIFPDVPLEQWLLQYPTLRIVSTTCIDCGTPIQADKPFLTKHYAGIVSTPCGCGSKRSGCDSKTTRTREEHDSWSAVIPYLK